VDIATKNIVSFEVIDEGVGDHKKFKEVVDHAGDQGTVRRVPADSAYNTREDFDFLEENGIDPGIKVVKIVLRGHGAVLLGRKQSWSFKNLVMRDGEKRREKSPIDLRNSLFRV
jgi:hypothetical protein